MGKQVLLAYLLITSNRYIKAMKKIHITVCCALLLLVQNVCAMDNTQRKNTVILAGLLTNTFAITNRQHIKACETQWDFGYMAGKDNNLYSDTLRLGFMRCDMDTSDILPWGIEFSVLPTGLVSMWNTSAGSYGSSLYELGFVPVGQFGKAIGPVFVDASFGLGPDLISRTSIGHQRKSTVLQFTDEMGVGISDLKKRVRLSLTYRHISNIDIKLPNNGTNFVGMGLSYRFYN
jgi:hypothetical protein